MNSARSAVIGSASDMAAPYRRIISEADLSLSEYGNRYSDEDCFENLLSVWTHYGRPPTFREMGRAPSTVKGKAYQRFGTWIEALEAFVSRTNSDTPEPRDKSEKRPDPRRAAKRVAVIPPEACRDIKLGLRFQILRRDYFKCTLCGNSPATDPQCRLHVDHVVPHSKGGKTVPANLRALCDRCNLGRGALYTD